MDKLIKKEESSLKKLFIRLAVVVLLLGFAYVLKPVETDAFSSQQIQRGAFGDDVIELQSRLQYISFYTGTIDGKFGYGTYWALRNFQEKYGLPVDGIGGRKQKRSLLVFQIMMKNL